MNSEDDPIRVNRTRSGKEETKICIACQGEEVCDAAASFFKSFPEWEGEAFITEVGEFILVDQNPHPVSPKNGEKRVGHLLLSRCVSEC